MILKNIFFGCILMGSCKEPDHYCYHLAKSIPFDSIPYKVDNNDLERLKGWYIMHRYEKGLMVSHYDINTNKIDLHMVYSMEDCRFKPFKTNTYYALSDSSLYNNYVNPTLVKEAYSLFVLFAKLDVSEITWYRDEKKILFTKLHADHTEKNIFFNYTSKTWSKW